MRLPTSDCSGYVSREDLPPANPTREAGPNRSTRYRPATTTSVTDTKRSTMKHQYIIAGIFAAAAMAGCAESEQGTDLQKGKTAVSLEACSEHFDNGTRATIDDGYEQGMYSGRWEEEDRMSVLASLDGAEEHVVLQYDAGSGRFKGEMTSGVGLRTYRAVYPATDDIGAVPFGRERTQSGNDFNSTYDIMMSPAITAENAEAGKLSDGSDAVFDLQHLTSIVAARFTTTADVAAENVKAIIMTADREISATSLLLDGELLEGTLAQEGASKHIAVRFDGTTPVTAAEARAFFNMPAGEYGSVTFDIITDNHRASFTADRTGKALEAGTLYYINREIGDWETAAAPSATWEGNEEFAPMEIESDMEGKCTLKLSVPSGIRSMNISIASNVLTPEVLESVGLSTEMDIIDNAAHASMLGQFGLPTGDALFNATAPVFDVGKLVPLILVLNPTESGDHIFGFTVEDNAGRTFYKEMTFHYTSETSYAITYNDDADLWFNTATLTVSGTDNASNIAVEYKRSADTEWQQAEPAGDGIYRISPKWESVAAEGTTLGYNILTTGTGVFLGNGYDYRLTVDGATVASGSFEAGGSSSAIPNASMDTWTKATVTGGFFTSAEVAYPNTGSSDMFWANGNNKQSDALCSKDNSVAGHNGAACAKLMGKAVIGNIFAPGNLFTGTMEFGTGFADMFGYASFGQKHTYAGRPSAMKVRVKATITPMTNIGSNDPDAALHIKGETPDHARIFVCITDWSDRHRVKSGASMDVSTFWDPAKASTLAEGAIIGYGSEYITASTEAGVNGADADGWVEMTIPIRYYDTQAAMPAADRYSIVVSVSASAYGDYLTGSTDNIVYIEDFSWVY